MDKKVANKVIRSISKISELMAANAQALAETAQLISADMLEAEAAAVAAKAEKKKPAQAAAPKAAPKAAASTVESIKFNKKMLKLSDQEVLEAIRAQYPNAKVSELKLVMGRYRQYKAANYVTETPAKAPKATPKARKAKIDDAFDFGT